MHIYVKELLTVFFILSRTFSPSHCMYVGLVGTFSLKTNHELIKSAV